MGNMLGNLTGGLLGESDASFHAKQANNQATTNNAEGQGYRQNAAGGYGNLLNLGTADRQQTGGFGNVANYGSQNMQTAQGAIPGLLNNYGAASNLGQLVQGGATSTVQPFQLTQAEQTLLNSHVDDLNRRQQSAIDSLHQELGQRGITDPAAAAAAEAQLRNNFGSMIDTHTAQYQQSAQQARQQAAQQAFQDVVGLGNSGAGITSGAIQGANSELEAGTGGLSNLGQQASGNALQQQQLARQYTADNNAALGSLIGLAGYGAGGGFGKATAPTAATQSTVNPASTVSPYDGSPAAPADTSGMTYYPYDASNWYNSLGG